MRIFGKSCKIAAASGSGPKPRLASGGWGLRPQTPALLLSPTAIAFVEHVTRLLALDVLYYFEK